MKTTALFPLLILLAPVFADPIDLPLYVGEPAGGVPLSSLAEVLLQKPGDPIVRVEHVQMPDIRVFLPAPEKANGAAVVICPGGGYGMLAIDHEGYRIAEALNAFGVAGIICKYRISNKQPGAYLFPIPLLDARQAMRLTREHAAEWKIDPHRVGVMGFSAGGHLASCVATLFDTQLEGEDPAVFQTMAHKPDFAALIYPVIAMAETFGHGGSKTNLLGKDPDPQYLALCNTHRQVTAKTPPTFLVSTYDDGAVPPRNSIEFYSSMINAGVQGELHIWEKGGHGYGMLPGRGDVAAEWMPRFEKWLRGRGLLGK